MYPVLILLLNLILDIMVIRTINWELKVTEALSHQVHYLITFTVTATALSERIKGHCIFLFPLNRNGVLS